MAAEASARARGTGSSRQPAVNGSRARTAQPRSRGSGWAVVVMLLFVAAYALLSLDPRLAAEMDRRRWLPSAARAIPPPASICSAPTTEPSAGSSIVLESELARACEQGEGGGRLRERVRALEAELEGERGVREGLRGRLRELEESLAAAQAGTLDGSAHASKVHDTTGTPPSPSRNDSASTGEPTSASLHAGEPMGGSEASKDSAPKAETSTAPFNANLPLGGSEANKDSATKAESSTASSKASVPMNGSVLAAEASGIAAPLREEVALLTRDSPGYDGFRRMAMKLAGMRANATMRALEEQDPFGVRGFERRLVERELLLNRTLEHGELAELFPCPAPADRITWPEQMSVANAEMFRNGTNGSFLFFQHMSKAAGTLFCKLAQANLPKWAVPEYYCMPDVTWTRNSTARVPWISSTLHESLTRGGCAGCLGGWSNAEIADRMRASGYRIACNEWDPFNERFLQLKAVFALVLRRPVDRAVSHFRFFCLNQPNNPCNGSDFSTRWHTPTEHLSMENLYTRKLGRTQLAHVHKDTTRLDDKAGQSHYTRMQLLPAEDRAARLASALDVVVRFHAVLVTEWLAYAGPLLRRVLGFANARPLVRETLPPWTRRNGTAAVHPRAHLGAAQFYHGKENGKARRQLGGELFRKVQEDLAVDEILTDAERRVFLERTVCGDG